MKIILKIMIISLCIFKLHIVECFINSKTSHSPTHYKNNLLVAMSHFLHLSKKPYFHINEPFGNYDSVIIVRENKKASHTDITNKEKYFIDQTAKL